MRRFLFLLLLTGALAGCGAGPTAPPPGEPELVCTGNLCVQYPSDWTVVEVGDDFISFAHPFDPEHILATAGQVNMRGLVENAGGSWPASTETAVRALWSLLDEAGTGEFGRLSFRPDGSIESFGVYEGGRLWHRLIPAEGERAIGMEVRAPNMSWEPHARIFLDSFTLVP